MFSRVLDFTHCFDEKYSPLGNAIIEADRINKLMITFPQRMETMNEKKKLFINSGPNKAKEVIRR